MASPLATVFSVLDSLKRNLSAKGIAGTTERTVQDLQSFGKLQEKAASGDAAAQQDVVDKLVNNALALAPGGIGGMILPAAASKLTIKQIKDALSLSKSGSKGASEAYNKYKAFLSPYDNELRVVIPDNAAMLNMDNFRTPVMDYWDTVPVSATFDVLKPRAPLSDVLVHPELANRIPDVFANAEVGASYHLDGGSFSLPTYPPTGGAAFVPGAFTRSKKNQIALGTEQTNAPKSAVDAMIAKLLHEVQHGVQYEYNLAGGGNSGQFYKDKAKFDKMVKAFTSGATPKSSYSPTFAKMLINQVRDEAYRRYQHIPGEAEAWATAQQFLDNSYNVSPVDIMRSMGIDPTKLKMPHEYANTVDASPAVQSLINAYVP